MIRELKLEEINEVNILLEAFNYKINEDSFNNPFFNCLVFFDDVIKGVIVYDFLYDRVEIEYISVLEQYKKLGIGTKLLNEIEKLNIKNITLEVSESNQIAINFYKKNGFKIVTKRDNYYGNEDGYLMIKELGE